MTQICAPCILFISFSYKKLLQCSFYENLKNWGKNRFFHKNSKKVCVLKQRACNKFKRNSLENYNDSEHAVKTKNAPFFIIFLNISFFHMIVTYWTGPLISRNLEKLRSPPQIHPHKNLENKRSPQESHRKILSWSQESRLRTHSDLQKPRIQFKKTKLIKIHE